MFSICDFYVVFNYASDFVLHLVLLCCPILPSPPPSLPPRVILQGVSRAARGVERRAAQQARGAAACGVWRFPRGAWCVGCGGRAERKVGDEGGGGRGESGTGDGSEKRWRGQGQPVVCALRLLYNEHIVPVGLVTGSKPGTQSGQSGTHDGG